MTERRTDRPGYVERPRNNGPAARYWNPRRAVKEAPKSLGLKRFDDALTADEVARLCRQYTDELRADLDVRKRGPEYDGTIASLIKLYRSDPESPYQALKHSTRIRDYEPSLTLIVDTVGKRAVRNLVGSDFRRWFKQWGSKGRKRRAHGAIRKLRAVLSWGLTEDLDGCAKARAILAEMEFATPDPRRIKMEYRHALRICAMAIRMERPSIALTQAIQWDTALRRIHIIGEWLPVKDGEAAAFVRGRTGWRGPTARDISPAGIFKVSIASKNKVATEHDLTACPLVQMVLKRVKMPDVGPLIVSETTGLPYRENYYATDWREIAKTAGVPDDVWSMDARAGAISEAELATDLEHARKMAGHTTVKTTQGYVRNSDLANNRKVAAARAKLRQ